MERSPSHIGLRRLSITAAAVLVIAALVLSYGISDYGVARAYSDPVARMRAQDESTYVSSAITMAQDGDWLSPKLLGRLLLTKPPLLQWLAATFIRLLGWSLFSVRLPCIIFGAAGIAACFAWCARTRSLTAGLLAAGVILASPLWQTFSRLCYTDVPAIASSAIALTCVAFDPSLQHRRSRISFGIFAGASLLAKSVAGAIPFVILGGYCLLVARPHRPTIRRVLETGIVSLAVVAPWVVYQGIVHPQWLWADLVATQTSLALTNTIARTDDAPLVFYLRRLVQMDVPVAVLGALGTVWVLSARKLRSRPRRFWLYFGPAL